MARIDFGMQRFCTGALIAPDRVLTAAHCLRGGETGAAVAAEAVRVRFGLGAGQVPAQRGVRHVAMPRPASGAVMAATPGAIAEDVAVLTLDSPLPPGLIAPLPIDGEAVAAGDVLSVVSFGQSRHAAAALQEDCRVVAIQRDRSILMTCEIEPGSSGSPVMRIGRGGPRVTGVISAQAETAAPVPAGRTLALAAPVAGPAARTLLRAAQPAEVPRTQVAGAAPQTAPVRVRRGTGDGGLPADGARFLRP